MQRRTWEWSGHWARGLALAIGVGLGLVAGPGTSPAQAQSLAENNEEMFRLMQEVRGVSSGEIRRIRQIFANSPNGWMGQGNPDRKSVV